MEKSALASALRRQQEEVDALVEGSLREATCHRFRIGTPKATSECSVSEYAEILKGARHALRARYLRDLERRMSAVRPT